MIRNIHIKLLRCLAIIIGLCVFSIVEADSPYQGQWYQIELVVFSHLNTNALDSEQWPLLPNSQPIWQDATDLQANQLLPKQDFLLEKETQAIRHHYGYHVLLHLTWKQRVYGSEKMQIIHIYGGSLFDSAGQKIGSNNGEGNASEPNWQVNGTIAISVERYFDVHLNLFFAEPVTRLIEIAKNNYFSPLGSGLAYFHMQQTRRMRSDELNYFDFPIYGVLMKIMPIKN